MDGPPETEDEPQKRMSVIPNSQKFKAMLAKFPRKSLEPIPAKKQPPLKFLAKSLIDMPDLDYDDMPPNMATVGWPWLDK